MVEVEKIKAAYMLLERVPTQNAKEAEVLIATRHYLLTLVQEQEPEKPEKPEKPEEDE